MKNLYPFLILLFLSLNIYAQSPEKMSYQAIVRDANNTLVANKTIGMQISILQSNTTGTVVYAETHTIDTNLNGLVSLEIGRGSTSDNFSTIDWSAGPYFIKTETDPTGGSSYTITGTSQLMSVPFALYANTSGSSQTNATNIAKNKTAIELNTAKVGYTEILVSANADVVANTAKTGITNDQASAIKANTAKTSMILGTTASTALAGNTSTITSDQASAIKVNTAKITNATHTGDVTGVTALTIVDDAVTTAKIKDANVTDAKIVTVSASKLTGAVSVAKGGTNISSYREGDFLYANSDGELTTLTKGTAGQVLSMNGRETAPEWKAAATGVAKDGYTAGDFLYAGGRGELTTLSAGRAGQVLVMDTDGTAPEWAASSGVAKDGYPSLATPLEAAHSGAVPSVSITNTCPALPALSVVNSPLPPAYKKSPAVYPSLATPVAAAFHSGAVSRPFIDNTCPAVPLVSVVNSPSLFAYKKSPSLYDDILVPPLATLTAPVSFEAETVTIFASVTLASLILAVVTASSTIVNAVTPVTSPVCVALVILAVLTLIALAWSEVIVEVFPANAVLAVVPKIIEVFAVLALIALAWSLVIPVLAVLATTSAFAETKISV